jgi:hypothetical protein
MNEQEISYRSGSSKKSVSSSTVMGALIGDKKSTRAIVDSVLNNDGRTYTRTKRVWICNSCAGIEDELPQPQKVTSATKAAVAATEPEKKSGPGFFKTVFKWFVYLVLIVAAWKMLLSLLGFETSS